MILVIFTFTNYAARNAKAQLKESIQASVYNAAFISQRSLLDVMEASRQASYDDSVLKAYQKYEQSGDKQTFYSNLNKYMRRTYMYNANISSAVIYLTDEPDFFCYVQNQTLESNFQKTHSYEENIHPLVLELAGSLDTDIGFISYENELYMVRNMMNKKFKPYAGIVIKLNMPTVFIAFYNSVWGGTTSLFLDGATVLVPAPEDGVLPLPDSFPENMRLGPKENATLENNSFYNIYGRYKMDRLDFKYIVKIDKTGLDTFPPAIFRVLIFIVLLAIPFMIFAMWFFYRHISLPLNKIIAAANIIQDGSLGYTIEGDMHNIEFNLLQDTFNSMSVRLKEQFERIYSEELALRDARIMALQSQINPHFLNNTLEIINWEARLSGNDKISGMIEALSTMLDAAMNRKSTQLVSLSQEMVYVDAYLYIVSERFGKRLHVDKDIDPQLLTFEIPRLIMQPIIENAVEHGMSPRQTCDIVISAKISGGFVNIDVSNNTPLSEKDAEKIMRLLGADEAESKTDSLHLGIKNVNSRLKMIYGDSAGLTITDENSGTMSRISIPFM